MKKWYSKSVPSRLKTHSNNGSYGMAEEGARKVGRGVERFPQWLKPHRDMTLAARLKPRPFKTTNFSSGPEGVPLTKTEFLSNL